MRRGFLATRLGAAIVVAGAVGATSLSSIGARAVPILLAAQVAPQALLVSTQADPTVVRSRSITVNFDALPSPGNRRVLREPAVPLDLFPDVSLTAVFDRYDPNATGVTWVGHVEGVELSTVTLVYGGGMMAGDVVMPGGLYTIRPVVPDVPLATTQPAAGDLHVVRELNQAAFPREAPPVEVAIPAADRARADSIVMADTAQFVDLMIVYTPTVLAALGGSTGLTNAVNLAVSEMNTSYQNSSVNQRVRLTSTTLVNYADPNAFSTALTELRAGVGALSGVPALRDANKADIVTLLIRPQVPDACGIGFLMTSISTAFAPNAFNVVDSVCLSNNTLPHELGHNMGARHDWYVDSATTPSTYSHGFVNPATGQRWRTIMSYNDLCTDQGFSCGRVLYWANPSTPFLPYCGAVDCSKLVYWFFPAPYMGTPAGTNSSCRVGVIATLNCDADDHRTLNDTALAVANFRQITTATDPALSRRRGLSR